VRIIVRDIFNKFWTGNNKNEEMGAVGKEPAQAKASETISGSNPRAPQSDLAAEAEESQVETGEVETAGETRPLEELAATLPSLETASLSETLIGRTRLSGNDSIEPLLHAAQRCHVGAVRARNEDSCFTFISTSGGKELLLPFGLFIVADGMGGHFAGDEASKEATRMVAEQVLAHIYMPMLKGNGVASGHSPQQPVQEVMERAVQAANQALYSPDPDKDCGTTLTAVLICGRRLYLAHVGDSRAYLLQDGQLEQLTTDHSYVERLRTVGQITAEEAASHPHRNVLYRAVGQGGELEIDTYTRSLTRPGKLVVCSDGLWGLAPEIMIQSILEDDLSLQAMADKLTTLALQGGGHDNITIIVAEFAV
jgi:PPM family protein phosphatase